LEKLVERLSHVHIGRCDSSYRLLVLWKRERGKMWILAGWVHLRAGQGNRRKERAFELTFVPHVKEGDAQKGTSRRQTSLHLRSAQPTKKNRLSGERRGDTHYYDSFQQFHGGTT